MKLREDFDNMKLVHPPVKEQTKEQTAPEVIQIDFSVPSHRKLLQRAYKEVYMPAFPIEEERTPLGLWMKRLEDNGPDVQFRYAIFVAGDNLQSADTCTLKGLSVGIYYREAQAGLMDYNAVAPSARGQGLGKVMVELRRKAFYDMAEEAGHELRGIYLEINDPEQVNAHEDSYSPEAREKLFKKWGALHIPINYIQPAITPGQIPFERIKLMCYPLDNPDIPTFSDVGRFINALHHGKKGPDYQTTMNSLVALSFKDAATPYPQGPLPNVPIIPSLRNLNGPQ